MMSHHAVEIVEAQVVDEDLVAAFARLMPQLSSSAPPPSAAELRRVVESEATTLLLARDRLAGGAIVGSLVLVVFRIPTGVRTWIEDVVVDTSHRGRGIGEASTGRRFASLAIEAHVPSSSPRADRGKRPIASTSDWASLHARPMSTATPWSAKAEPMTQRDRRDPGRGLPIHD